MISQNLQIFVQHYGVRRLLFLERELLEKFEKAATAGSLPVECGLAEA